MAIQPWDSHTIYIDGYPAMRQTKQTQLWLSSHTIYINGYPAMTQAKQTNFEANRTTIEITIENH